MIPYGREITTFVASSGEIVHINTGSVRAAGADHTEFVDQKMGQLILFQKGRLKRNLQSKGHAKHLAIAASQMFCAAFRLHISV